MSVMPLYRSARRVLARHPLILLLAAVVAIRETLGVAADIASGAVTGDIVQIASILGLGA